MKNIQIYKKNNTNYEKTILVIGVVHGDEPQGEFLINEFLNRHDDTYFENGKNRIFFIPRLNSNNSRKNINGVDLNRNFPTKNWIKSDEKSDYFGGFEPNSEEETKTVVELMSEFKFDAIITIHAPFRIVNYDSGDNCKIAPELADKIALVLNYPVQKDIGYPTPGSFGTYTGVERKIPTITIELSEKEDLKELSKKFEKIFDCLINEF